MGSKGLFCKRSLETATASVSRPSLSKVMGKLPQSPCSGSMASPDQSQPAHLHNVVAPTVCVPALKCIYHGIQSQRHLNCLFCLLKAISPEITSRQGIVCQRLTRETPTARWAASDASTILSESCKMHNDSSDNAIPSLGSSASKARNSRSANSNLCCANRSCERSYRHSSLDLEEWRMSS